MAFVQNNLIRNIKTYLINRDRATFAEQMSPGYCRGLTLLFCYFAMNEKLDAFKSLIQNAIYWQEDSFRAESIEKIRCSSVWQEIKIKLDAFLSENVSFKN